MDLANPQSNPGKAPYYLQGHAWVYFELPAGHYSRKQLGCINEVTHPRKTSPRWRSGEQDLHGLFEPLDYVGLDTKVI